MLRRFPLRSDDLAFPKTWPADCPPADADDAEGDVFRVVEGEPPGPEDFVSHFESGKLPKAPPCLRCGLSVFRDAGDAFHQRALLPKLGRYIARGALSASAGKTKLTGGKLPTHTTWWAYENVKRESLFVVFKEED